MRNRSKRTRRPIRFSPVVSRLENRRLLSNDYTPAGWQIAYVDQVNSSDSDYPTYANDLHYKVTNNNNYLVGSGIDLSTTDGSARWTVSDQAGLIWSSNPSQGFSTQHATTGNEERLFVVYNNSSDNSHVTSADLYFIPRRDEVLPSGTASFQNLTTNMTLRLDYGGSDSNGVYPHVVYEGFVGRKTSDPPMVPSNAYAAPDTTKIQLFTSPSSFDGVDNINHSVHNYQYGINSYTNPTDPQSGPGVIELQKVSSSDSSFYYVTNTPIIINHPIKIIAVADPAHLEYTTLPTIEFSYDPSVQPNPYANNITGAINIPYGRGRRARRGTIPGAKPRCVKARPRAACRPLRERGEKTMGWGSPNPQPVGSKQVLFHF